MSSRSNAEKKLDFFFALPEIVFIYPSGTNLWFPKIFLFLKNTHGDDTTQTHTQTHTRGDRSAHCGAMAPECDIKVSRVKVCCYSKERSKDDVAVLIQ